MPPPARRPRRRRRRTRRAPSRRRRGRRRERAAGVDRRRDMAHRGQRAAGREPDAPAGDPAARRHRLSPAHHRPHDHPRRHRARAPGDPPRQLPAPRPPARAAAARVERPRGGTRSACSPRSAVRPGSHSGSVAAVGPAREDEQQVGEAVEVAHALGVDLVAAGRSRAARRAGRPCGTRAAGRRRASRRGARRTSAARASALTSSQALLEPGGLLGRDAQPLALAAVGHREVGAHVEEVVLDAAQPLRVALAGRSGSASATPSCALSSSTVP